MTRRILVTGSRDWNWHEGIWDALLAHGEPGDTLVQGGAAGADAIAARYWQNFGPVETHRADWDRHGKAAGPIRNQHMVSLGADLCLAFIKNNSRGATHCADLAEGAGIETQRFFA